MLASACEVEGSNLAGGGAGASEGNTCLLLLISHPFLATIFVSLTSPIILSCEITSLLEFFQAFVIFLQDPLLPPSPRSPGETRTSETNWERLVREALCRERLGVVVSDHQPINGGAGNVPSSLTNYTHSGRRDR